MHCVHRLRILRSLSFGLSASHAVTSDRSGWKFSGRAQASGLRSFGKCAGASPTPASFPPNKSFKPTPCRGIGHVLYATLAHVRRPATGRLNSGVRRQKNIRFQPRVACSTAPLIFAPLPSFAAALIPFGSHTMLRIVRMARLSFACVAFARFGNSDRLSVSLSAPDAISSDTARKVRKARSGLTASAFGSVCWARVSPASRAA